MMRSTLSALFLFLVFAFSSLGCDSAHEGVIGPEDVVETSDVGTQPAHDVVHKDTGAKPDATKPDTTKSDVSTHDTAVQPDSGHDAIGPCHVDTDCDDKDACTQDKCQWGTCYYVQHDCGEGKTCYTSATGQLACAYTCNNNEACAEHNTNECVETFCQMGTCQFEQKTGTACNDNDACTLNDSCNGGVCQGEAKECANGCHEGACLPACQNDANCADADPCTDNTCVFGTCQAIVKLNCCSELSNTCEDDNNLCTKSVCGADNVCGFEADNNATCTAGGLPGKCEASTCWNDTTEGSCYDGDPCTDDATSNGTCVHSAVCADGDPCTTDLCVAQPNGLGGDHTCIFQPKSDCCLNNSDCDDADSCTVDSCSNLTCEHDNKCLGGEPEMFQCESDEDCIGSEFGDYCVVSSEPTKPALKLCQPCQNGGEQDSCPEGNYCFWGIGGANAQLYSVYWCEAVVCTSASECDDNDPCTTDGCGLTECSHNPKANCTNCSTGDQCVNEFWCDEKGGGLLHRTDVCQDNGTCEVLYSVDVFDNLDHGCNAPIQCQSNGDCPASGDCILGNCYYQNGTDYPECGNDTHCLGTGTCNNATGVCNEYDCYAVQLGNDTLSVKACPNWLACVDNQCVEMTAVNCQTDNDCQAAGVGGYCAEDPLTNQDHCYSCLPDSATETIDLGCGDNLPHCTWEDSSSSYNCVECTTDSQCGFGTTCQANTCQPTTDIMCQVNCQEGSSWTMAVIWYGNNLTAEVQCGEKVIFNPDFLCLWGTGQPVFKYNMTDGVWAWGGGTTTNLQCNYAVTITPDPAPSSTPNVTMGDLGVAVASFNNLSCGN